MCSPRCKAVALAESARAAGKKVVFTNGCFDGLHVGHKSTLLGAVALGDVLIVGVNSDWSVRELKGNARPIVPQADRAARIAALGYVNAVVIFDEATPHELLKAVRPDVLVKGGSTNEIIGREIVEAYGGRVVKLPLVEGVSTTKAIADG